MFIFLRPGLTWERPPRPAQETGEWSQAPAPGWCHEHTGAPTTDWRQGCLDAAPDTRRCIYCRSSCSTITKRKWAEMHLVRARCDILYFMVGGSWVYGTSQVSSHHEFRFYYEFFQIGKWDRIRSLTIRVYRSSNNSRLGWAVTAQIWDCTEECSFSKIGNFKD